MEIIVPDVGLCKESEYNDQQPMAWTCLKKFLTSFYLRCSIILGFSKSQALITKNAEGFLDNLILL